MFHILKSLHDFFIINPMNYIFLNVHSLTIIYLLISHSLIYFKFVKISMV